MLEMDAPEVTCTGPAGDLFDLRDEVNTCFAASVHSELCVDGARHGDVLTGLKGGVTTDPSVSIARAVACLTAANRFHPETADRT